MPVVNVSFWIVVFSLVGTSFCRLGACPTLPFVTRRRKCGQMEAAGPEKPEVYSLEYMEDFSGPSTTQMVADRSPQ